MLDKVKTKLGQLYLNRLGWKTEQKIIVFESDDWGNMGMPSRKVYTNLLSKGIKVDDDPYAKFDSLASNDDLDALINLLQIHSDANKNHPIITLNVNPANPDYHQIKKSNFENYYFECFTETLKRYKNHNQSFELLKKGIDLGCFEVQYHGREHLNTELWLEQLRLNKHKHFRQAFENDFFSLPKTSYAGEKWILNTRFYPNNEKEHRAMIYSIGSGIQLFKTIFNLLPSSFIGTGYFWNKHVERELANYNIKSLQGIPIQKSPDYENNKIKHQYNFTGRTNEYNQIYLVRNCFFEPSLNPNKDVVNDCLFRIEKAFQNKKPAIIGTHRLNFIGEIQEDNRTKNLKLLNQLLIEIKNKWGDVHFLSSGQLEKIINNA